MYTLSMGKMYTLSTEKSITSLYTLSGEINNILVYLIYMGESVPTYVYLIYKEIIANLCIVYPWVKQYQSMYTLSMGKMCTLSTEKSITSLYMYGQMRPF